MPFRFRKIFSLGKGMRINLSKRGLSTSIGKPGATLNFGKHGVKSTMGIPGSGLSFSQDSGTGKSKANAQGISNFLALIIAGIVVLCLGVVCCVGVLFLNDETVTATETPSPIAMNVSTIIVQTANAAIIETRSASSPTPNITPTTLPTLTLPVLPTLVTIPTSMDTPIPTNTIVFILPTQPASSGNVCSCSGDSLNCSDFSSQSSAQSCFNSCMQQGAGDIHNLDGDGNGLACESLP